MNNKNQNGKMGRPPLPAGTAKDIQIGVRISPDDNESVEQAVDESGVSKVEWLRNVAKLEAKPPPPPAWVNSKWTREQLIDKTVQFKLAHPRFRVKGVGKFRVRRNPLGELAIEIVVDSLVTPYQVIVDRYWLGQEVADKIEVHPDTKIADFRLFS